MSIINFTLTEYLQNHPSVKASGLDSRFIAAFAFGLDNLENKFPINIESVVEWVGYNKKSTIVEILRSGYVKNQDYIEQTNVTKKKKNLSSGRPKTDFFLSIECFKGICIKAQTERGKQVREYFLLMEQIAKEFMIKKIEELTQEKLNHSEFIGQIHRDYKEYINELMTAQGCVNAEYVYVMTIPIFKDRGLYKVGFTKNLDIRREQLGTSVPEDFIVEFSKRVINGKRIEYLVHERLSQFRFNMRREYFKCDLSVICDAIENVAAENDNLEKNWLSFDVLENDFLGEDVRSNEQLGRKIEKCDSSESEEEILPDTNPKIDEITQYCIEYITQNPPNGKIGAGDHHNGYLKYCKDNAIERPLCSKKYAKVLEKLNFKKTKISGKFYWDKK